MTRTSVDNLVSPNESQGDVGVTALGQFLRLLYEQLSTKRVGIVAATDGRVLVGCDRISVLLYQGSRCKILAISHVETVQRLAGLSRAMRKLARAGRNLLVPLVLDGDFSSCPANMRDAIADFLSESRSHSLMMVPLVSRNEMQKTKHDLAQRRLKSRPALGMLLIEQFTSSTNHDEILQRVNVIAPHVANAFTNAIEYESVWLLPLWRSVGTSIRWLLGYPKLAIFSTVAAIVALCVALALIPAPYRVHADGRAMPSIQHEIFAKSEGIVTRILVVGGQRVSKGDTLLHLENKELEIETIATKNEINESQSLAESLGVQKEAARQSGNREAELQAEGEQASALVKLEGAKRRLELLEERSERLIVVSDFDGVVATFQPEELLRGRPVQQGDLVLEVMEDKGDWRLELDIPEYRMGHVLKSLQQHGSLKVKYIAMTEVFSPRHAELTEVATRTDHREELGAYVRAHAPITQIELAEHRIGAEVSAKVYCPGYSLFYCIFGDIVEFLERNIWW